jgi:acyl-CoA thioester hydrolase
MGIFKQQVIIRETYLDVFGHVNNAAYLKIFEDVRWDLIVSRGFDMSHIRTSKTGPVILECNIKFLKELKGRDLVTVTVELMDYQGKVGHLRQQMILEDQTSSATVACEAIFTFALFDLEKRKLLLPTPEWKHALE